ALADYPSYDPNDFGAVDDEDRGNRSISKVFEPGSTGKLFTIAAALEEGTAQVDSQYEIPSETSSDGHRIEDDCYHAAHPPAAAAAGPAHVDSQYEIPYETSFDGHRIKDARYHEDQRLTLAGVLSNSSNVGTVQISEEMEPQIRHDYLTAFGLGQPTGVGLPGESAGIVHPAEDWTGRTRYTTAFGQGYSVNALQMTSAVGSFANQGVRVDPRVVAGTREDDGSVRPLGEAA